MIKHHFGRFWSYLSQTESELCEAPPQPQPLFSGPQGLSFLHSQRVVHRDLPLGDHRVEFGIIGTFSFSPL